MTRITRTLAATASGLALAFGGLIVTAVPASADTPNYVSKAEFRRVHKGMTMRRVHRIFDVRGKQTYYDSASPWWPAEQWREYSGRSRWSYIEVDYKKRRGVWRVSSKNAYWG